MSHQMDWIGVCTAPLVSELLFYREPCSHSPRINSADVTLASLVYVTSWDIYCLLCAGVCISLLLKAEQKLRQKRSWQRWSREVSVQSCYLSSFLCSINMISVLHNVPLRYPKVFGLTLCKSLTSFHPPPLARRLGKISYKRPKSWGVRLTLEIRPWEAPVMNFKLNSRLLAKQRKHDLNLIFGWSWHTDLIFLFVLLWLQTLSTPVQGNT